MRSSLILISLLATLLSCTDRVDATYRQGLDLYAEREYGKALPFISKAAEAGHKDGMAMLGAMYLLGRGVKNNSEKATQWLELAAGKGHVQAQSILGIAYATGVGVARDIPEAKKWLKSASKAGDKHAIRMLRMIEGPR